ncbi:hypothetical protein N665_10068s0001 [Sinapis alba]|nr:hypothetical protein N665_10068s0001 [Sinapis alba]
MTGGEMVVQSPIDDSDRLATLSYAHAGYLHFLACNGLRITGPSLKVSLNEHKTGSTPLPTAALKSTSSPLPSAPMPSGHRPPQGLGDDLALCVSMNQERITTYSCA